MSAIAQLRVPAPRVRRLAQVNLGLVLFGVSLAMLVGADLGLDPWDVLHQGLATSLGLPLGGVVIIVSVLVLALWIPLRERPGLGTVLNAVVVGTVFEAANAAIGGRKRGHRHRRLRFVDRAARPPRPARSHHLRHQSATGRTAS